MGPGQRLDALVVVPDDPAGASRAAGLADRLAGVAAVTTVRADGLAQGLGRADVVLTPPLAADLARLVAGSGVRTVLDLRGTSPLGTAAARDAAIAWLDVADHTIVVGDRERDVWLGVMMSRRLITVERYDDDPSLRAVIDALPDPSQTAEPFVRLLTAARPPRPRWQRSRVARRLRTAGLTRRIPR